jgi:hypothetical protein
MGRRRASGRSREAAWGLGLSGRRTEAERLACWAVLAARVVGARRTGGTEEARALGRLSGRADGGGRLSDQGLEILGWTCFFLGMAWAIIGHNGPSAPVSAFGQAPRMAHLAMASLQELWVTMREMAMRTLKSTSINGVKLYSLTGSHYVAP